MTAPEVDALAVQDMLDKLLEIEQLLAGNIELPYSDRKTQYAVFYCLAIIGEASSRLSEDSRKLSPNTPWRRIKDMRNRLLHGYDNVTLPIVWETIQHDLPQLKVEMLQLQAALDLRNTP